MSNERSVRRDDLKRRLVEAARARIRSSGLQGLRARDVTADAGCALGGLYTAFADLDELVLHVNSMTLARLGEALGAAAAHAEGPRETFLALAQAYLDFATGNGKLWAALFEHRMPPGIAVPDWHLAEHAVLIRHLIEPLAELRPSLDQDALLLRARTIFAAVHGIIAISLEKRFIGLDREELGPELGRFVDLIVVGVQAET